MSTQRKTARKKKRELQAPSMLDWRATGEDEINRRLIRAQTRE